MDLLSTEQLPTNKQIFFYRSYFFIFCLHVHCTWLPTKYETVKTTQNSEYMTSSSMIFGFCIQLSILMVYKMFKHRNKTVLSFWPINNPECKITDYTNSVQTSLKYYFVGNPVYDTKKSCR